MATGTPVHGAAAARTGGTDRAGTTALLLVPAGVALVALPVMLAAAFAQQVGAWSWWTATAGVLAGAALAAAVLPALRLPRVPWPVAAAVAAVAVLTVVWGVAASGEHVVVRRDPGAYATYALALARVGGVPLDPGLEVFGLQATDPWVRVSAAANYSVAGPVVDGQPTLRVEPQFLVGVPALLSLGWWVAGWPAMAFLPALATGLALCAVGALGHRLLGGWGAALAVALLALAQPVALVARQTFSEPFSLLYLMTGAALLVAAVDATRARDGRLLGLVAGVLLGANLLVRIDAVRELVLLVPAVALLAGRRHPAAVPLAVGALASGVPAALATRWWSSPYIASVMSSLGPLVVAGALLLAVSLLALAAGRVLADRWHAGPPTWASWAAVRLPLASGGVVAAAWLVLASRPLWLVDTREPYLPGQDTFVEALQQQQGLVLDGTRTYAEDSVTWLVWWLGPATVLAAAVASVALTVVGARAVLTRRPLPGWVLPFVVGLAVTLVSLYRPAITPDHPWADRRYVTVTYPFVVLCAVAALVAFTRWLPRRAGGGAARPLLASGLALSFLVPTALATAPVALERTEVGQVDAARQVCGALEAAGPDPAVLTVGFRARVEWAPVVRALCGVPLVGIEPPAEPGGGEDLGSVLARAAAGARANGATPVVLVGDQASAQQVADATGVTAQPVVDLATSEPARLLEEPPTSSRPLTVQAWVVPLTSP
ncbi:hypothetical protein [Aquipuribacter nitratireducens]|uniref:Glycosyltransferase RgtA/B/C/D-like domain-containing protein n=1 Tax=Aquipuribacter nitratireducens TaxID=650104 RepID=A0ABW0GLF0_9MICO